MADSVNELIDKLAKIEESAGKTMSASEDEKKMISREHEKRIADFDRQLEDEYKKKLDDIAGELKEKASNEIAGLCADMKKNSDKLDNDYSEKKDEWINSIFEAVIAV